MDYRNYFKFCLYFGLVTGCLPIVNFKLIKFLTDKYNKLIAKGVLISFFCTTLFVVILDIDFLSQHYSDNSSLSSWIFSKGKDLAFTGMGISILIACFTLRYKIKAFYDKIDSFLNRYGQPAKSSGHQITCLCLTVTALHVSKVFISHLYDMIADTDKMRRINRIIFPYKTETLASFYLYCILNLTSDALQTIQQGFVSLLFVLGVSFISDMFDEIVIEIHGMVGVIDLNFQCKHDLWAQKNFLSVSEKAEKSRWIKLKAKWDQLEEIFEIFNDISSVFLCIMFPATTCGVVARLGAGIVGVFSVWNWSDYGSRVYSGIIYCVRISIFVEMGHRFKRNVIV
jgi:hypothetical protein